MHRGLCLPGAVVLSAALFNVAYAAAAPSAPLPLTVRIQGATEKTWIAAVPLSTEASSGSWEVAAQSSDFHVPIKLSAPTLLCIGDPDYATECRNITLTDHGLAEKFALATGRSAGGRCFLGRRPAAKAEIRLLFATLQSRLSYAIPLRRSDRKLEATVPVAQDGTFVLDHVLPGTYVLDVRLPNGRIHRTGPIVVPQRRANEPDERVQIPVISIEPGVDVTVGVQTLDGKPMPNAGVGIWQERGHADERPIVIEGLSDRDGKIVLSGADPSLPLRLTCSAKAFVRTTMQFERVPDSTRCTLEKFAAIHGEVRDERGNGRSGAVVSVSGQSRSVITGQHGAFAVDELAAGEYQLHTALAGYRPLTTHVVLASEEEKSLAPIELSPGDTITGHVRDAETGMPVSGAMVRIVDPAGAGDAVSDEAGSFSLTTDRNTNLAVETTAAGYAASHEIRGASTDAGAVWTISLAQPGRLEVMVWDEDADAPCAGCTVHTTSSGAMRSARTDSTGVAVFADATPGDYEVTREFASAGANYVRVSGGGVWRSAVVKPRETTRVQLGEKATRISVTLSPALSTLWQLRASCPPVVSFLTADPSGIYVVRKRDEACTVSVVDGTRSIYVATIPDDFRGSSMPIMLGSGTVVAVFKRGAAAITGLSVELIMIPSGRPVAFATTLADGSVVIPYISPGAYLLAADGVASGRTLTVSSGFNDAGTISTATP